MAPPAPPVWLNGRLVPEAEAVVSAFDHGLIVGDGVFETLRTFGGRPFAVRRHLDRLARSAQGLGLDLPDRTGVEAAVTTVLDAAGLPEARVRITVTSGPGPLGSARGTSAPTVVVAVAPLDAVAPAVDVVTVPWTRNEGGALAGLKTTSYAENAVALARAHQHGASEAVFANTRGELCEGTGTNVVLAVGGRLVTPPLSSGCLAGVTRDLVLEVADVVEATVPLSALAEADEAALLSSTRSVQAIGAVDGRPLDQVPGPLTTRAAEAFAALVAKSLDP
jgi:branched-chain amino acid aminotransferase